MVLMSFDDLILLMEIAYDIFCIVVIALEIRGNIKFNRKVYEEQHPEKVARKKFLHSAKHKRYVEEVKQWRKAHEKEYEQEIQKAKRNKKAWY